jgi:hypothetical protein
MQDFAVRDKVQPGSDVQRDSLIDFAGQKSGKKTKVKRAKGKTMSAVVTDPADQAGLDNSQIQEAQIILKSIDKDAIKKALTEQKPELFVQVESDEDDDAEPELLNHEMRIVQQKLFCDNKVEMLRDLNDKDEV